MSDFLMDLANKSGISPEQAKKAMGALLSAVKGHVPAEHFTQLSQSVPGSDEMMAAADAEHGSSSGGVLGAVAEMAGKIFGGGGATAFLEKLGHLGLSADQVKNFLPQAIAFLKSKLPPDVMAKISHLLPAEETPAS